MNRYQITALIASHSSVYLGIGYISGVWRYETIGYFSVLLAGLLIWVSVHDIISYTIPNEASFLLVVSGMAVTGLEYSENLGSHVFSGILWGGVFWGVAILFKKIRGYNGLGLGDAKLMVGAGTWLGPLGPISVVLLAATSGIVFMILIHIFRQRTTIGLSQSAIAFGPFLCLSIWSVWTLGPLQ